jgi:hypothetical protein
MTKRRDSLFAVLAARLPVLLVGLFVMSIVLQQLSSTFGRLASRLRILSAGFLLYAMSES